MIRYMCWKQQLLDECVARGVPAFMLSPELRGVRL